ncbi:MAG: amidohydrolase family protein [Terracidiphilus sp.]
MPELLFSEAADWDLFDVNMRLGSSGIHGELALDAGGLLREMDRFWIRRGLAAHWECEEYDVLLGNEALEREIGSRMMPAWGVLPEAPFLEILAARKPAAVRLTPARQQSNFSLAPWCAGDLFDYLQQHAVVTLIASADIGWNDIATLLENFPRLPLVVLETGYRADRYLFPLLERFPTLHFDSSTYLAHRQLEAFVESHGHDRILFGTRLPLYTPAASLNVLASSRISDTERLAIAGGNLRRLIAASTHGGRL